MPKTIYVTWDDCNGEDETYLVADESIEPVEDGQAVGVYELRQVRRKIIKHELA